MTTTVFCTSLDPRQLWQAELLEHSFRSVRQPGELVHLVAAGSGAKLPAHQSGRVIRTRPWNPDSWIPDPFPGYDVAASVQQWLSSEKVDDSVLLLEPGSVLRGPVMARVEPGRALATPWPGLPDGRDGPFGLGRAFSALQEVCDDCEVLLPAICLPILIHSHDLLSLAARWLELMKIIRTDCVLATGRSIDADRLAYAIAAAEQGVQHELETIAVDTDGELNGQRVLTYRQAVESARGEIVWDGHTYRPWQRVPPDRARPGPGRALLTILDSCIDSRESDRDPSLVHSIPGRGGAVSEAAVHTAPASPGHCSANDDHDFAATGALLDVLIISEDRACRLDALLRNLHFKLMIPFRAHVFYNTSSAEHERGYDLLRRWHRGINWIVADAAPARTLASALASISGGSGRFLLPLAEDVFFVRPFEDQDFMQQLDADAELAAVCLGLGDDVAGTDPDGGGCRWRWAGHSGQAGAPMSLGGHVYRAPVLAELFAKLKFSTLQGVEAALAKMRPAQPMLARASHRWIVRTDFTGGELVAGRGPSDTAEQALNRAFLSGFSIDLRPIEDMPHDSSRGEAELSLLPDARPRNLTRPGPLRDPWRPRRLDAKAPTAAGDGELVQVDADQRVTLNETAGFVLEQCSGELTREEMLVSMRRRFRAPVQHLKHDLQASLEQMVDAGLVAPARLPEPSGDLRRLDLREIPVFVINCKEDRVKRKTIETHLGDIGLDAEIVAGLTVDPSWIGVALSHLKVLRLSRARPPFLVLEDDCEFFESFDPVLEIPAEADAVSLGLSIFGLETPGCFSWGQPGKVQTVPYTSDWLRVYNMLARHAVLYLSSDYQEAIIASQVEALTNRRFPHMGDIGCAMEHASHLVLAPHQPLCRQREQGATARSLKKKPQRKKRLSPRPTDPAVIAACLSHFQEVNESRKECLVFELGDRGFFAELTSVARGMIWAWTHELRFVLDSSRFTCSVERGWEDYFEPFCASPKEVDPGAIRRRVENVRGSDRSAALEIRYHQPERIEIGGLVIGAPSRGFQQVLGLFTSMIFRPNRNVRNAVARLTGALDLGSGYGALHLRRGDKVGDEDLHYPAALYLDRLAPLGDLKGLFVMSDDSRAVVEVREESKRRGRQLSVATLTGPGQSGFNIGKLRSGEPFMAHDASAGKNTREQSYLFDEIVRVLAEVSVAARSKRFVSTFFSNVGRTVWFLHHHPQNCILMQEGAIAAWNRQNDKTRAKKEDEGARARDNTGQDRTDKKVQVELLLRGGHNHGLELERTSVALARLLELRRSGKGNGEDVPGLIQLPLDGGRASLTFRARDVLGLEVGASPALEGAVIDPIPAQVKPGSHPFMNVNEGHLGGYIRAQAEIPINAHGDPLTWAPELWRWLAGAFEVSSVLDVGCGEAHAASFFRDLGCLVLGVDGSREARRDSKIPDRHLVHDYQDGPFVPKRSFDLVWSCEFVEHVEERFTQNFFATFAAAAKLIVMTFAPPGQKGWHHVNLQPQEYWINKVERLGFRFDSEFTDEARRRAGGAIHAGRCLLFVREPETEGREFHVCRAGQQPRPSRELAIHDMEIARHEDLDFFLFLDIFVHPSRQKIVAVAPFYDRDWDPGSDGVDLERVDLLWEGRRICATYLPHRLDSWEPCVLYEFSDPALLAHLEQHETVHFTVEAGPHRKDFELVTRSEPAFNVAMSLIVRNENRWIRHFLEYYLGCMGVDHVWVYDHGSSDREELFSILSPYQDRHQVTYIPWNYRWRNREPAKMIAQPQQEAHSLNRFANSRWIGFLDVDELLRIPGRTLPEYLAGFERAEADGLSFGLRWFVYKGPHSFDRVTDPPLSFLHAHRDDLGRKRQKLFVRPDNVRFLRLHWLEEGKRELQVDDTEIFFHHYTQRPHRFEAGKAAKAGRDGYMLRFSDRLRLHGRPPPPSSVEQWIEHIEAAFVAAEENRSNLPPAVFELRGMCGVKTRHFYNNLCDFDGCRFLEIGSWFGASVCAAVAGNRTEALCIDNWSEFGGSRGAFEANLERWRGESQVHVLEADCFEVDVSGLGPFDVFLYDGDHRRAGHRDGVLRFAPALNDLAVLIVDDWNWPRVRGGTMEAIDRLDFEVLYRREIILPEEDVEDMPRHRGAQTWWNGLAVFLLSRRSENRVEDQPGSSKHE